MNTQFCRQCDSRLESNARVCSTCGAVVSSQSSPPPSHDEGQRRPFPWPLLLITTGPLLLAVIVGVSMYVANPQTANAQITIKNAWVRPAIVGQNSAVYFQLVNEGLTSDVLVGAASLIATAELHQTIEKEDGVMGMIPLNRVDIPAQSEVELTPGGKHIMLINLTQPLTVGENVSLTLNFEHTGNIVFEAEVRSLP